MNTKSPTHYITSALRGEVEASWEHLEGSTLRFERLMTGLRDLEEGVDIDAYWEHYEAPLKRQVDLGNLSLEKGRIRLTEQGLRLMNTVLLDLI